MAAFIVVALVACATTPFRDVPVEKLSDQQLVSELAAAAEGIGRQLNKAEYLLATKPDPFYVLSSSTTNYFGTSNVVASGYVAPVGRYAYFYATGSSTYSGTAQTSYYYTDVNALAETMHLLGAAIAQGKAEANRRRGLEVQAEIQRRVEAKRLAAQQPVDQFFAQNKTLSQDKALVTAVLAWVPANAASPTMELERAKATIDAMQRGPGLGGDWYGVVAQRNVLPDGRAFALNNFVHLKLRQDGARIIGSGELATREAVEVDCYLDGDDIKGRVTNRTAGFGVSVAGTRKDRDKVSLDFSGTKGQIQLTGKVALFR